MNHKKVSIIIPVYNVGLYLKQCLDSLLVQTYQDLEIILINDGSTDQSPQICNQYACSDNRIKVIHKSNGGAASARNVGLDSALGDYICFVDSDDYAEPNYIQKLLSSLQKADADVSVCTYKYIYQNVNEIQSMENCGVVTGREFTKRFLDDWKCGLLWNKLFKASLMRDVRFEEGHKIDDEFFTYKVVLNAEKIVLFDDALYNYRMRASSVMNSRSSHYEKMLQDRFEYLTKRYIDVSKKYPDLTQAYLENLIDNFIRLLNDSRCSKSCYERMSKQISECLDWLKHARISFFLKRAFYKALKSDYVPMEAFISDEVSDKQYFI